MIRLLVLAILLVLLGVGSGAPEIKHWSLAEVDAAVTNPDTAPDELISLVEQISAGVYPSFFDYYSILSPSGKDKWTVEELENRLKDLDCEPSDKYLEYRKALKTAHTFALQNKKTSVYVRNPATWIQTWTKSDLNKYLDESKYPNRSFDKQVRSHRNMLAEAIKNGKKWKYREKLII